MRNPVTFTAATADLNDATNPFRRIDCDPDPDTGDQVARFAVHTDGSSGSATLQVVLVRNGAVVAYENATCTAATTRRTAADNNSGDYISTVVFTHSGTDKIDLMGMANKDGMSSKNNTNPESHNANYEWWYGITDLTTVTEATVYHAVSPKV